MRKRAPGPSALAPEPGAWEGASWPGSSPALPGRAGSQALAQPWAKPHFLQGKACLVREAGAAASWGPSCSLQSGPDGRILCGLFRGLWGDVLCGQGPQAQSPVVSIRPRSLLLEGTLQYRADPHPTEHGSSWAKSSQLFGG